MCRRGTRLRFPAVLVHVKKKVLGLPPSAKHNAAPEVGGKARRTWRRSMLASAIRLMANGELQRSLLDWYARERRDLPWRTVRDPYATLVSETMLQQTRIQTVLPYYERFMRE